MVYLYLKAQLTHSINMKKITISSFVSYLNAGIYHSLQLV